LTAVVIAAIAAEISRAFLMDGSLKANGRRFGKARVETKRQALLAARHGELKDFSCEVRGLRDDHLVDQDVLPRSAAHDWFRSAALGACWSIRLLTIDNHALYACVSNQSDRSTAGTPTDSLSAARRSGCSSLVVAEMPVAQNRARSWRPPFAGQAHGK